MRAVSFLFIALSSVLYSTPIGRVVSVIGTCAKNKVRLKAGDVISEEDRVRTAPRSGLKILLNDRTIIELGALGDFKIQRRAGAAAELFLESGIVRVLLNKHTAKPKFFIRTQDGTMALKGTQVVVKRLRGKNSFSVISGNAEVLLPYLKFAKMLEAGQQLRMVPAHTDETAFRYPLLGDQNDSVGVSNSEVRAPAYHPDGMPYPNPLPTVTEPAANSMPPLGGNITNLPLSTKDTAIAPLNVGNPIHNKTTTTSPSVQLPPNKLPPNESPQITSTVAAAKYQDDLKSYMNRRDSHFKSLDRDIEKLRKVCMGPGGYPEHNACKGLNEKEREKGDWQINNPPPQSPSPVAQTPKAQIPPATMISEDGPKASIRDDPPNPSPIPRVICTHDNNPSCSYGDIPPGASVYLVQENSGDRDISSERHASRDYNDPQVISFDPANTADITAGVEMPSTIWYAEASGDGRNGGRQTRVLATEASLSLKPLPVSDNVAAAVGRDNSYTDGYLDRISLRPVPPNVVRLRLK